MTLLTLLAACMKTPGTPADFVTGVPAQPSSQALVCQDPALGEDDFCMPAELEKVLRDAPLTFLDGEVFGTGVSGVMKVQIELKPADRPALVLDAKWKPAPKGLTGLNNSPRKEVATYQIQSLFMPPERYVVPPTVMRCVPTTHGRPVRGQAAGPELPCVWGMLSQWVENITPPERIDRIRLAEDPEYRLALADLNLLLYVVSHRDTHAQNWFLSTDPDRVRAVAVDNGMTFSGIKNPRLDVDWSDIIMPALPQDSIDNLRRLTRNDLNALLVVGSWRVKGDHLEPAVGRLPDSDGVLWDDGLLAHGLSKDEVDALENRINELIERVDNGEIPTFDPAADDIRITGLKSSTGPEASTIPR